MRILLDQTVTNLAADSVADGLRKAAALASENGRLIVEVEVDGILWSEEDLAASDAAARSAGELKLQTAHAADLLVDTFVQAAEAVVGVEEIQCEAAKLMQANRTKDGLNQLLEALTVWGAVQTGLSRGLALGVLSRESLAAHGIDVEGPVATLEAKLRDLRQAIIDQDETAMSDCLLYEFPPVAKQIASMLRALAREAAAVSKSARG
jgi:urease gamma subunit